MPKKKTVRYKPEEITRSFVLRLPENQAAILDGLVKKRAAKSKNELIVQIIDKFISALRDEAEVKKGG